MKGIIFRSRTLLIYVMMISQKPYIHLHHSFNVIDHTDQHFMSRAR